MVMNPALMALLVTEHSLFHGNGLQRIFTLTLLRYNLAVLVVALMVPVLVAVRRFLLG